MNISITNQNTEIPHTAETSEIKLATAALKEALPGLTKVSGRSRSLPVLQSVRIHRSRAGVVSLQATDLDSFLTYTIPGVQPGGLSEVLVPIDQLTKAMKCSAAKDDIGIVPEAKDKVKLRYRIAGNVVEQTISTLPASEYPAAPHVRQPGVQVEPQFGQALKEALACCSDDSSRPILGGACLDVNDQRFHYIVGTNGRLLFSANSFCFTLPKSVIIPDSKFLSWSDFLDEQPAYLSVEPGQVEQKAKADQPAKAAMPGWVKLESPRWTFVTREIEGSFPNWKQVLPAADGQWTEVMLSDETIKQLIQIIPNLPGSDTPNQVVRLQVDRCLTLEGQNQNAGHDEHWTRVPVPGGSVRGKPVTIALNREYLLKALRFGLSKQEIQDPLSPMVLSRGGKKMVIMPVRMEKAKNTAPEPATEAVTETSLHKPTDEPTEQPATPAISESEAPTPERTEMPQNITSTQPSPETRANDNPSQIASPVMTTPPAIKSLVEQADGIKDTLRAIIREVSTMVDTFKAAEKEKRATDKEIEVVRAKLRQIQSVSL